MDIQFDCPRCGTRMTTDVAHAGAEVSCPSCGQATVVPKVGGAAPDAPPPPPVAKAPPIAVPQATEEEDEPVHFTKRGVEDEGMDMTPMVDVTFLLLIFFMVTAAYSLQKSIEVPPPDESESASQARTLEEIEEDDNYIIIEVHRDNTIWVNEREAPSRQEVLSILRESREGPPGAPGPTNLLVLADGDAKYEMVIMALDAGNAVGMESVRLASMDAGDF